MQFASNHWRADLKGKGRPTFPIVPESRYKLIRKYIFETRDIFREKNKSLKKGFREIMLPVLTQVYETTQWDEFTRSSACKTLKKFRSGWYHDPLLHQTKNPYMRVIRKCRLGKSELRAHSHFHEPCKGKICTECKLNQPESLEHYFLKCPAYNAQRKRYFDEVQPILSKLGHPTEVKFLLGFDDRLTSKKFSAGREPIRKRLYLSTCRFMKSTKRFKFV